MKYMNITRLIVVALVCIFYKILGGTIWGFIPITWSMALSPIILLGVITLPDIVRELKTIIK